MKNPIRIIIEREYLTRVRKKSFIVMTILAPILIVAAYSLVIYLMVSDATASKKNITIWDESGLFYKVFSDNDQYTFAYIEPQSLDAAKEIYQQSNSYALVYIPKTQTIIPETANIFAKSQIGMSMKSYVKNVMQKEIERIKLKSSGVSDETLASIKSNNVSINAIRLTEDGKKEERSYPEIRMILSMAFGILIYFVIFLFGSQVMNGVMQEKTNRVVEVMISTVKPMQLMAGKIIGVALVGLTQFVLWIVFALIIMGVSSVFLGSFLQSADVSQIASSQQMMGVNMDALTADMSQAQGENIKYIMESVMSVNYGTMLSAFFVFFIFGYLLYASLFAAVGAIVDNESDTQQFILPITIPMIIALVTAFRIPDNPDGPIAVALSLIPFTSPISMMARLPFGVPWWQLLISIALLVITLWFTTWLSAKIYRTGILMYGKKASFKELWKWVKR
ncbi:MAG: ABC transporter permease [Bacteroidales bacterium]|nr:ABC transporter permease [Bacteroidales bacterium]